jgi:hypothetical protein
MLAVAASALALLLQPAWCAAWPGDPFHPRPPCPCTLPAPLLTLRRPAHFPQALDAFRDVVAPPVQGTRGDCVG